MTEPYETFNTKGCPYEILLGNFYDQPILIYYDYLLNNDNNDDKNIPGTPVDDVLPGKKWVEDLVVPNDEDIYDERIIGDADILTSAIYPLQN